MSPTSKAAPLAQIAGHSPDPVALLSVICPRCLRVNEARALQPFGQYDGRSEWSVVWQCWCGERIEVAAKEIAACLNKNGREDDAEWMYP